MSAITTPSILNPAINPYSQQPVNDNSAASTTGNAGAIALNSDEQSATGQTQGTHHGHHHHGGGAHGLQSQIQQAVTSALSDADDDSDPNDAITAAIEQVLQNPASAESDPATTAAQTPADPAADQSQQSASATFEQFLQSQGVNMDQFKSDLTAAFAQANSTGSDPDLSAAFSQLPPGSVVDASA